MFRRTATHRDLLIFRARSECLLLNIKCRLPDLWNNEKIFSTCVSRKRAREMKDFIGINLVQVFLFLSTMSTNLRALFYVLCVCVCASSRRRVCFSLSLSLFLFSPPFRVLRLEEAPSSRCAAETSGSSSRSSESIDISSWSSTRWRRTKSVESIRRLATIRGR